MVDQSFIDELKRRNAERAEKLKRELDMGDLSKLGPSEPSPEDEVFRETSSSEPPPPPASSAATMPPPPPAGIGGSGSGAPPPPPSATPRSSAAPPPPPPTISKQEAPAPSMENASDRFDEPIAPSTGIWDEILGGVTRDAQELEQKRGGAEEFAVPTLDEDSEEPITSGEEPSTGDTSEFIVPKFGASPGDKPATSEVAASLAPPTPAEPEPEPISAGEDAPTGDTDEFLVPSFASTPGSEVPATPEPVAAVEDAPAEDDDEFVVPKFGSTPAVAEVPEPVPSVVAEQPADEEFVVPTFDSAPVEEPVLPVAVDSDAEVPSFGATPAEQPADEEFVVPTFDSAPAEELVLPVAVASEVEVPSFDSVLVEQSAVEQPVIEQVVEELPVVEPADFIQPVSVTVPAPIAPAKPATREPVMAEKEPEDANIHRIVLEISGAELRLKRLNISLREAANLLEIAAEECRKLLE